MKLGTTSLDSLVDLGAKDINSGTIDTNASSLKILMPPDAPTLKKPD
jgi:hypothetical protein